MIQGFFNTIQNDVLFVYHFFTSSQASSEEQKNRVTLATVRIFAALMIARACLHAVYAISKISSNLMMEISIAVIQFVLAHDIFILARNVKTPASPLNCIQATFFGIYNDVVNLRSHIFCVPQYKETNGTFLHSLWNKLIAYQYPNPPRPRVVSHEQIQLGNR